MQVATNAGYIFDQLTSLLEKLSDNQYAEPLEIFSGASIGRHYRHIIEFFQSVSVANETDTICYDNRIRDVRIETDKNFSVSLLKELKEELSHIENEKKLTLISDIGSPEHANSNYISTTLYREFHYVVEHAIHHMAIIKMGVQQSFANVSVSNEFGVAPSTLRYQQSVAQH